MATLHCQAYSGSLSLTLSCSASLPFSMCCFPYFCQPRTSVLFLCLLYATRHTLLSTVVSFQSFQSLSLCHSHTPQYIVLWYSAMYGAVPELNFYNCHSFFTIILATNDVHLRAFSSLSLLRLAIYLHTLSSPSSNILQSSLLPQRLRRDGAVEPSSMCEGKQANECDVGASE